MFIFCIYNLKPSQGSEQFSVQSSGSTDGFFVPKRESKSLTGAKLRLRHDQVVILSRAPQLPKPYGYGLKHILF
jgi:hypothetical protein